MCCLSVDAKKVHDDKTNKDLRAHETDICTFCTTPRSPTIPEVSQNMGSGFLRSSSKQKSTLFCFSGILSKTMVNKLPTSLLSLLHEGLPIKLFSRHPGVQKVVVSARFAALFQRLSSGLEVVE